MSRRMRRGLVFWEPTLNGLLKKCRQLRSSLESESGEAIFSDLRDSVGPLPESVPRVGFVWDSRQEAVSSLARFLRFLGENEVSGGWRDEPFSVFACCGADPDRYRPVAVFSGQGSLYPGMGAALAARFPIFKNGLAHMDGLLTEQGLHSVSGLVYPSDRSGRDDQRGAADFDPHTLYETQYAQPAIGVFAAGLFRIFEALGFKPSYGAGLSFGEVMALWAGRVFSDRTLSRIVLARGMSMALSSEAEGAGKKGGMMSVAGDGVDGILPWVDRLPRVVVESRNAENHMVLSGVKSDLQALQFILQDRGFDAYMLPVSGAFHSPFMEAARKAFERKVASIDFGTPVFPVFSNETAEPYPARMETIRTMLADHIVRPVRFREMIENIYESSGRTFVEFGPKNHLTRFIGDILSGVPHYRVSLNAGNRQRSQHRLDPPLDLIASFQGHPPFSCTARSLSCEGLRLDGLPRSLGCQNGPVSIRLGGPCRGEMLEARLMWRQARIGGIRIMDAHWSDVLFPRLVQGLPEEPGGGPDAADDRTLLEAVVRLRVLGYRLGSLDALARKQPEFRCG